MADVFFEGHVATTRLSLYTARAGAGRPLLFLGGSGFDMRLRRSVFNSPLVQHFSVAAYEPRGLGRSERPPGPWTMADYADDACALLDALGWDNPFVVGESFGGMVALELALRHPKRVKALCVAAATAGGALGRSYPIEELVHLKGRERAIKVLTVQDSRFAALLQQKPDTAQALVAAYMQVDAAFWADAGNAQNFERLLAARAQHDVGSRLHQLSTPSVVMAGRHDGQAKPEHVNTLAQKLSNSVLWTFEGGHGFAFATPQPMQQLRAHWADSES